MQRAFGFVIGLMIGVLTHPGVGRAAELVLRAPEGCGSAQEITEQVERLVGQRLAPIEGIDFELDVEPLGEARYRLVLRTLADGSAPRTREIEGSSCIEVADAASVAIALALSERTRASDAQQSVQDESADAGDAQRDAQGDADAAPADPDPEPTTLRTGFTAGLLFESGALPEIGFGVELGASLEYGVLKAAAAFSTFASQEARLPGDERGGDFDLLLGSLQTCVRPSIDAWHALGCAGFELGALTGEGRGVADPRGGTVLWAAPRAELGAGFAFSKAVRLWLRGGLAFALHRPEFRLEDTYDVHKPANLSLRGLLSLELVL